MAKNYTLNEAVKIIAEGKDFESIADIGRRYPVLLHKLTIVIAKAGQDFVDLMTYMPDYLTANKVNTAIKNGISESSEEDDEDADNETETNDTEIESDENGVDYESMSAKQLWDILGKAGLRKTAKSTKKADLVAACKAMDAAKDKNTSTEDDEDDSETETTNPYEGKSAMELFKECKKRGIKATSKKAAKFYIDLLMKDDAKNQAEDDEDDSEDWGDEEETAKSETKSKKADKAKSSKQTKKVEEDDDDDWDI